jgi:exoribonuclease II
MKSIPRIITADCSFPREIDDGLFVDKISAKHDLYRVGVCVVDTAKVYPNQDIKNEAFSRTAADYYDLPGGERGYDPMIDPEVIKDLEFTEGSVKDALIVTFLVGRNKPPHGVEAKFGKVEVTENLSYKEFAEYASAGNGTKYARTASLIKGHLGYVSYGDHAGVRPAWRSDTDDDGTVTLSEKAWKNGSKMNEAFMVATNHLIGRTFAEEERPAIYRVHDPEDEQFLELMSANMARFSRTPGIHSGLGLEPYSRVTSPLRRLDDFVMNNQLKKRFLGMRPTAQDTRDVAFAIRRLNQEAIAAAPKEIARFSRRDILGRTAMIGSAAIA